MLINPWDYIPSAVMAARKTRARRKGLLPKAPSPVERMEQRVREAVAARLAPEGDPEEVADGLWSITLEGDETWLYSDPETGETWLYDLGTAAWVAVPPRVVGAATPPSHDLAPYRSWWSTAVETARVAYRRAVATVSEAVAAAPESYRATVAAAFASFTGIREDLEAARASLQHLSADAIAHKRLLELEGAYMALAAPAYHDATVGPLDYNGLGPSIAVGVAPILVVGGIAVTVGGVAWIVDSIEERRRVEAEAAAFRLQIERCAELAHAKQPIPDGMCVPRELGQEAPLIDLPGGGLLVGAGVLGVAAMAAAMWRR